MEKNLPFSGTMKSVYGTIDIIKPKLTFMLYIRLTSYTFYVKEGGIRRLLRRCDRYLNNWHLSQEKS